MVIVPLVFALISVFSKMMLSDSGAISSLVDQQDMKRRIQIIEEAQPQLAVSIHQNSYGEEYVNGAQVFYYKGSRSRRPFFKAVKGMSSRCHLNFNADSAISPSITEMIQNRMIQYLDPENHRQAKANDSYYLLKKTGKPIVIVECGFLSNSAEAEKLCDNYYQEKVAWNIHMSIMQYLNTREK